MKSSCCSIFSGISGSIQELYYAIKLVILFLIQLEFGLHNRKNFVNIIIYNDWTLSCSNYNYYEGRTSGRTKIVYIEFSVVFNIQIQFYSSLIYSYSFLQNLFFNLKSHLGTKPAYCKVHKGVCI